MEGSCQQIIQECQWNNKFGLVVEAITNRGVSRRLYNEHDEQLLDLLFNSTATEENKNTGMYQVVGRCTYAEDAGADRPAKRRRDKYVVTYTITNDVSMMVRSMN